MAPLLDTQGNSKLVLALLLFLGYTRAAEKLGAEKSGNPGKGLNLYGEPLILRKQTVITSVC